MTPRRAGYGTRTAVLAAGDAGLQKIRVLGVQILMDRGASRTLNLARCL